MTVPNERDRIASFLGLECVMNNVSATTAYSMASQDGGLPTTVVDSDGNGLHESHIGILSTSVRSTVPNTDQSSSKVTAATHRTVTLQGPPGVGKIWKCFARIDKMARRKF